MANLFSIFNVLRITAFLLWVSPARAQQKFEREYTIKGSQIHPDALKFINESFRNVKVHWYGEESLTGTTIEAKLKSSGKQYSIEFSKGGEIHDIEILTPFKKLPDETRKRITKQLEDEFNSYKVVKTQTQWTGTKDLLKTALAKEELPDGVVVQYELIVRAKKTSLSKYYEVLFEGNGKMKSVHEIIQRNVDNLIY
ncbi:MAG: hypothetical protein EOO04_07415 [Chitinophagaceae bacterium]|nr:MAG: hypothetical protein EOO04_07415 [Chitinophagaceae bacterium]